MKAILGKKIGMTQIFDEKSNSIPVTVLEAGPCFVTQIKTEETDGYNAVQLGFDGLKEKKTKVKNKVKTLRPNKPMGGHFKKSGVAPLKYLKEVRCENTSNFELGQEIKVDVFEIGDLVNVTGISKGKGFQGCIKRHGFHRGPMSHGSHYHRRSGSLGASASPARVFKGKKMPGKMGNEKITAKHLEVVKKIAIENGNDILCIKGSVPGREGTYLLIKEGYKKLKKGAE